MHPVTSCATLLLLPIAALADNFEFTFPQDDDAKVDLSRTVQVTWEAGDDGRRYTQLDLEWTGETTGGTRFTYSIEKNLTLSSGSYSWDPVNETSALTSGKTVLTDDDDFYFVAKLHNINETVRIEFESDKFPVTGYANISSLAAVQKPGMGLLVLAGLLGSVICMI
ncbi:hypothetical protein JX265_012901 [Neoarthrinium moseri]|uniref:Uncharacterized protein n=1 Tax=Neoarthrinium moseri TaxID=1658444 RepID=A0A9P9W9P5_9PEZI|nr:hypothetical protein JX265_012901 [Neoarthrinium moseri]